MSTQSVTITDTPGLMVLIKDNEGRSRGPVSEFAALLDPGGTHVLGFQMLHNDVEWRCRWLCKLAGSGEPAELWIDNSFDAFDSVTFKSARSLRKAQVTREKQEE